jgi:hypothetical protein
MRDYRWASQPAERVNPAPQLVSVLGYVRKNARVDTMVIGGRTVVERQQKEAVVERENIHPCPRSPVVNYLVDPVHESIRAREQL